MNPAACGIGVPVLMTRSLRARPGDPRRWPGDVFGPHRADPAVGRDVLAHPGERAVRRDLAVERARREVVEQLVEQSACVTR